MAWMNEGEIDEAVQIVGERAQEYFPYVQYLSDWRDIVNRNSDGWPYWKAGAACASKLMDLTADLMNFIRFDYGSTRKAPGLKAFQAALTPIKSCATRHKLPAPVLGRSGSKSPKAYMAILSKDDQNFIGWLQETLIPDLKEAGNVETAADFERLIGIINRIGEQALS